MNRVGYAIVEAGSPQELAERVQQFLNQGFIPVGFAAVGNPDPKIIGGGVKFYQTLFFSQPIMEVAEQPGQEINQ